MINELYKKLTWLQWLLQNQHMRNYAEGSHLADTTRGQGRILAALKMQDGISTKDLAYLLGLHIASLNELLAKLVKSGYVTRESFERDKRVMLVKLTDKGRNEEQPEMLDFRDIFSCLSDDEQKAFGDYLDRVIVALQTKLGSDGSKLSKRFQAMFEERHGRFTEMGGVNGRCFDRSDFHGDFGRGHGGFRNMGGFSSQNQNNDTEWREYWVTDYRKH
ncbi:MAG: MarR family transcriptional regulator [Euryarchaeota archaeon]|nr:MarR family transcriptional regulator [Euryarchaeota archaeon]